MDIFDFDGLVLKHANLVLLPLYILALKRVLICPICLTSTFLVLSLTSGFAMFVSKW